MVPVLLILIPLLAGLVTFFIRDEKVARLHLSKIGVVLDELTDAQAEYLGIGKEGPFKAEHYRY